MKKFILASAFAILIAAGAYAQTSTRSIHVSGYNSVSVSSAINIIFDSRFEDSIFVDSPTDLIDKLSIEIKGTSVSISYKKASKNALNSNRKSTVYMSASHLTKLSASGDNEISSAQTLAGKSLQIKLSGESSLKAAVEATDVSLKLSGSSKFDGMLSCSSASVSLTGNAVAYITSGKCSKLSLTANGESEFKGRNIIVSNSTKCSLGASSKAELVMNGNASITTTGSASLLGQLSCKKTNISMNKTSRIAINGSCKTLVIKTGGNCDFKNPNFVADNSAACTVSGSSTVDINCRGNVSVKASDASNINIQCDGTLKIAASGTSNITYLEGTKVSSLSIKDQATSRAVKQRPVVYNPTAHPLWL